MAKHGAVYHWPNSNPERLISRLVVAPTMYQILEAEERILVLQESIVECDRFESDRKQNVHASLVRVDVLLPIRFETIAFDN